MLSLPKQLTIVRLKDGQCLFTEASVEAVAGLLNTSEFAVIDGVGFNKYEVKTFETYQPDDIEQYVLGQSGDRQKKLQAILTERKTKELPTNGVEHLLSIYNNRYGIDKN